MFRFIHSSSRKRSRVKAGYSSSNCRSSINDFGFRTIFEKTFNENRKKIKYTLTKEERISSKIEIDRLFTEGKSFIAYPLRVVFIEKHLDETSENAHISIMISVPKKKFKRAVKRNRLKRLIKEAYRLNKLDFIEKILPSSKSFSIAFLYLSSEEKKYLEIESAMKKALETLSKLVL